MLEAGKTPPINLRVRVRGKKKAEQLIALLRDKYKACVEVVEEDDDELVNAFETDWYRQVSAEMTPGDILRIRRENAGLSQSELGGLIGSNRQNISGMETGKRPIGKESAKKLAAALGLDYRVLL